MEYISGSTLDIYLRDRSPLSVSEAVRWFSPLAEAVDYAHRKGVIHRDIKPSNVMLGTNDNPYLLDFGIARQADSAHTQARRLGAGTWEYMAPEQFDDDRPAGAMDVYSFGATLYFALVGRAPFSAVGIRSLLREKEAGCPALEIAGLERHAAEALRSSMDVDIVKRPESCGALLKRLLEKPASIAVKPPVVKPDAKPVIKSDAKPLVKSDAKPLVKSDAKPLVKSDAKSVVNPSTQPTPTVAGAPLPPAVQLPETLTNSIGMQFQLIKPGTFLMGSPESESGRYHDEVQHQVTLTRPYYLGVYPVTQEEYERVMGSNPSRFKGRRHPVEQVSWEDATSFISKLNALPSEKSLDRLYRLPTEAEWEYACRAGTPTAYSFGESESELGKYAWYNKNSGKGTHAVGQKLPNCWGLYDMHGNVWEWCADWYVDYPKTAVTDPPSPKVGSLRVIRGGSWYHGATICRSSSRNGNSPSPRYFRDGFRVALSPSGNSRAAFALF
jgi:formylglycine-generating enzyme required for sulfatase activity